MVPSSPPTTEGPEAPDASEHPVAIDVPMNVTALGARDDAADRGSFVLGLLAGFIGGALFLALFYGRSKPATRSGILWGFMLQLLLLAACWQSVAKLHPWTR